jgi:hypothetical protein
MHSMKACMWGRGIAPLVLNRGTRWSWMIGLSPRLLSTRRKEPLYPLNGRLYGLQSQSWLFGEEKYLLRLPGFEPRIVQPVVYSAYRLRFPGSHNFEKCVKCKLQVLTRLNILRHAPIHFAIGAAREIRFDLHEKY